MSGIIENISSTLREIHGMLVSVFGPTNTALIYGLILFVVVFIVFSAIYEMTKIK